MDALEHPTGDRVTVGVVQDWLHTLSEGQYETFDSPGAGQDVRIKAALGIGACLVVEDTPVQAELFAEADTRP